MHCSTCREKTLTYGGYLKHNSNTAGLQVRPYTGKPVGEQEACRSMPATKCTQSCALSLCWHQSSCPHTHLQPLQLCPPCCFQRLHCCQDLVDGGINCCLRLLWYISSSTNLMLSALLHPTAYACDWSTAEKAWTKSPSWSLIKDGLRVHASI